jgi:tRNA1Val (adenine37-N6)-methyltransferase
MSIFQCKQFALNQEGCAMKLNTDALLLGAWAGQYPWPAAKVLDIGTGTGILALMQAQCFPKAQLLGLDLDAAAAARAAANFAQSPWADRLQAKHLALQALDAEQDFDWILSNPPFYPTKANYPMPEGQRKLARQTDSLPLAALIEGVNRAWGKLEQAHFLVILPLPQAQALQQLALAEAWHLHRCLNIRPLPHKAAHRQLLHFCRQALDPQPEEELCIRQSDQSYSAAYRALLQDFLIIF